MWSRTNGEQELELVGPQPVALPAGSYQSFSQIPFGCCPAGASSGVVRLFVTQILVRPHEGTVRARHLEQQTEQAWCLTLTSNAVIAWTAEYFGLAVGSLRRGGRRVDDELLAHISPAHSENVNFFGAIEVDIDAEFAQLGPTGYRPLRAGDTLF